MATHKNLTGNPASFPAAIRTLGTAQKANEGNFEACFQDVADALFNLDGRVDEAGGGTVDSVKDPVRTIATASITLSGTGQTISGRVIQAGDRVLPTAQATGANNRIYVAGAGAWSAAADFPSTATAKSGLTVTVSDGDYKGSTIQLDGTADKVIGADALTWLVKATIAPDRASGILVSDRAGVGSIWANPVLYLRSYGPPASSSANSGPALRLAIAAAIAMGGGVDIQLDARTYTVDDDLPFVLAGAAGIHFVGSGGYGGNTALILKGNVKRTADGTSTTSITASAGTKTFTTQAGQTYYAGCTVRATSRGSGDFVEGACVSYSSTSLQILVGADDVKGSGTRTDWDIINQSENCIFNVKSSYACGFRRMRVDCRSTTSGFIGRVITTEHNGVSGADSSGFTIDHVDFEGEDASSLHTVWATGFTSNAFIHKVHFRRCRRGVELGGGPIVFSDCIFNECQDVSADSFGGQNHTFTHCVFQPVTTGLLNASAIRARPSCYGLNIINCWFGDAGASATGRPVDLRGTIGGIISGCSFNWGVAASAPILMQGCIGVPVTGNGVIAAAIVDFGTGAANIDCPVFGNGYTGATPMLHIANGGAQHYSIGSEYYFANVNVNIPFLRCYYGMVTNSDGAHNMPLGGLYSLAIGASAVLPTWGAAAGGLIALGYATDHGYRTGLMYIPNNDVAGAGHDWYWKDAAAAKGQSPGVTANPVDGLSAERCITQTRAIKTVAASGAAQAIDWALYQELDIVLTADCTLTHTAPTGRPIGACRINGTQDSTPRTLTLSPAPAATAGGAGIALPAGSGAKFTIFLTRVGTDWRAQIKTWS